LQKLIAGLSLVPPVSFLKAKPKIAIFSQDAVLNMDDTTLLGDLVF
jgi:hypothetical protein